MLIAVIDTETGERLGDPGALPLSIVLPDGGSALFEEIGQIEPEHAPRYKAVEQAEMTPLPAFPCVEVSKSRQFYNGREEITREYAPDRSAYQREIEAHVALTAAQRGYSSTVSLASYVASTIPLWKAEAEAFIAWRDQVWVYALTELGKVQSGEREPPALAAFMGELPAITWPSI